MRIGHTLGHAVFAMPRPDPFWVLPECRVGLEFEFENPNRVNPKTEKVTASGDWTVHDDGSLRDNGVEFVLRQPMLGTGLRAALEYLFTNWPPLEQTYRTSVHVHIDAADLELPQLQTAVLAYALVEAGMFNYVGKAREESNYCVPWYNSQEYLRQIAERLFNTSGNKEDHLVHLAKTSPRYAALNINALLKYGSLEFRHLGKCNEYKMMTHWINSCMSIKRVALETPYDEMCGMLYAPAEQIYRKVFGDLYEEFFRRLDPVQHHGCVEVANALISHLQAEQSSADLIKMKGLRGENPMYTVALERMTKIKKERE